jgi:hypothetical protein
LVFTDGYTVYPQLFAARAHKHCATTKGQEKPRNSKASTTPSGSACPTSCEEVVLLLALTSGSAPDSSGRSSTGIKAGQTLLLTRTKNNYPPSGHPLIREAPFGGTGHKAAQRQVDSEEQQKTSQPHSTEKEATEGKNWIYAIDDGEQELRRWISALVSQ